MDRHDASRGMTLNGSSKEEYTVLRRELKTLPFHLSRAMSVFIPNTIVTERFQPGPLQSTNTLTEYD